MLRNRIYVSLGVIGVIALTAILYNHEKHSDDVFIKKDSMGRPVLKICHAVIYDESENAPRYLSREKKCSDEFEYISQGYVKHNDGVYWIKTNSYSTSPCITGTGDTTALFYNLSWECVKAQPMQINIKEENRLYRISDFTPSFSSFDDGRKNLEYWQHEQLISYAKDNVAVYYKGKKIDGAIPTDFTPIFPFDNSREWISYSVAKGGVHFYLNGKAVGLVNLELFKPLKVVRCPKHGLSLCGGDYELTDLLKYGNWFRGVFGTVGEDVVFLQPDQVTIFKGMASQDMFSFATSQKLYLHTKNKFYELAKANDNNDMKLIDMDISFYNENP